MTNVPKPSNTEEEYFAREEAEKKRKLHAEENARKTAAEREAARKLHHMKCPKCGSDLAEVAFRDVQIDRCFTCNGVFLDAGELEHLAGKDHQYVNSIIRFFAK